MLYILLCSVAYAHCISKSDCHHGNCINGQCACDKAWRGDTCNTPFCVYGRVTSNHECRCKYGHTLHKGYCDKPCNHGNFSQEVGRCVCNSGWTYANFLDTMDWFKGECNQFKCKSEYQCQQLLPHIKHPSCPIKGWNCYCPHNIGYENGDAKCMDFTYWLGWTIWKAYLYILQHIYSPLFTTLIIISLPFGTRRYRCDHYTSWWFHLKNKCGLVTYCRGNCVRKRRFYCRDDLAFSIYWFKTGLWWTIYSTLITLSLVFIWSIALWITVILISIGICSWFICRNPVPMESSKHESTIMITHNYGGPLPKYKYMLANYVAKVYPLFPDNMQGGCIGYLCGTHSLNGHNLHTYWGKILSLNWCNSRQDLRDDTDWHSNIIQEFSSYNAIQQTPIIQNIKPTTLVSNLLEDTPVIITRYNYITLYSHEVPITEEKLCYQNRQFIQDDECWICNHPPSYWHKWNCNHVFCRQCSLYMIDRDIACPLCRKKTNSVHAYPIESNTMRS